MTAARFSFVGVSSARKARTVSGCGGRPVRSIQTRRRNSESLASLDGRIFIRFHLAATSWSISVQVSGSSQTNPTRLPMTVSVVAA